MITGIVLGIVIGFIFSMPPLGPTYFAIIERGLKKELGNAVAIGVGAGFMDMVYILVAYGGVSAIAAFLPESFDSFLMANEEKFKLYLAFAGCIIVILYGIKIIKNKSGINNNSKEKIQGEIKIKAQKAKNVLQKTEAGIDKIFHTHTQIAVKQDIYGSFFLGILMCLSSPTLPASWFATVGYLKSYGLINSNYLTGIFLAVGVLLGTSFWFYLVTKFISKHTDRINPAFLRKMNITTGVFLVLLGMFFMIKVTLSVL